MPRRLVSLARVVLALGLVFLGVSSLVGILIAPEQWIGFAIVAAVLLAGGYLVWPRTTWRDDAPSQRQLSYAADLGIDVPRGATKGQVSDLISAVTGR